MTIPYILVCRWAQDRGPSVTATRTGDVPFVPCRGFAFMPWDGLVPCLVEHVEWNCEQGLLIIEAEYRDRGDFLPDVIKKLQEKGVAMRLEGF